MFGKRPRPSLWLSLLAMFCIVGVSAADEKEGVRTLTEWTEDDGPLRVDCGTIPIVGGGFGGATQSCEEQLSLYALFNCFPMKREAVEESCPDWKGLQADVDWRRVAQLIDARAAEKEAVEQRLERQAIEYREREKERETENDDR